MRAEDQKKYARSLELIRSRRLDLAYSDLLELHRRYPESSDVQFALEHSRAGLCDWADWDERRAALAETLNELSNGNRPIGTFPLCYVPVPIPPGLFAIFLVVPNRRAPT